METSHIDLFCSRIIAGDPSALRTLLDSGVDLNLTNRFGDTPLTVAASTGLPEIVKALREQGALVNQPESMDMTALHEAAVEGHDAEARLLIESGAGVGVNGGRGDRSRSVHVW